MTPVSLTVSVEQVRWWHDSLCINPSDSFLFLSVVSPMGGTCVDAHVGTCGVAVLCSCTGEFSFVGTLMAQRRCRSSTTCISGEHECVGRGWVGGFHLHQHLLRSNLFSLVCRKCDYYRIPVCGATLDLLFRYLAVSRAL